MFTVLIPLHILRRGSSVGGILWAHDIHRTERICHCGYLQSAGVASASVEASFREACRDLSLIDWAASAGCTLSVCFLVVFYRGKLTKALHTGYMNPGALLTTMSQ